MTSLLIIDPGLSTGVAQLEDQVAVTSFTTKPPHSALEDTLRALQAQEPALEVVCEQGPTNHRRQADACAPVEAIVRREAKVVHWIRPTQWKGHPASKLMPDDDPKTRHERDALRMGRWFLATQTSRLVHAAA